MNISIQLCTSKRNFVHFWLIKLCHVILYKNDYQDQITHPFSLTSLAFRIAITLLLLLGKAPPQNNK